MMQGAVGVLVLSALLCLGSGLHHEGHEGHHSSADHAANSLTTVTSANREFAFNLYRLLANQMDNQGKNIFFSPSSVSLALAALSVGARGQTHQQLFSALGFNSSLLSQADVDQAFHGLLTGGGLRRTPALDVATGTAVFLDDKFQPRPAFLQTLRLSYLADAFSDVDFSVPAESVETINAYVERKTRGKIDQLVEDLDPATVMYLISYIYYKGKWQTGFDPAKTKEDMFNVDEQKQVPVQMMNVEDQFHVYYDQQISTTVVRLPFNSSYSMLLMLPDRGRGLAKLEQLICPTHYTKWLHGLEKRKYSLFVPKFSIKTNINLKGVLRQMGMTDMFVAAADFSGIAEAVSVSQVVHQVTLDIEETGATASAAAGVGILARAQSLELRFNRPFVVLIADSDNILFLGRIVNPNL